MARQVEHQRLVDLDVSRVGQQLLERLEPRHEVFQAVVRDRRRLGGERRRQRVVELLDVLVLLGGQHAGVLHAVAQRLQERRQAANHFGALLTRHLRARRPDEVGGGTLHRLRFLALQVVLHRRHGQHVGPHVEQEVAHAFLHRHLVEHLAQLDGVLDGQRLALLHLLGQRHALARRLVLVLEVVLQELLEFGQHRLEHAPARVGIRLHDLHHALDLLFDDIAGMAHRRIEAHHAGAHAVDQPARGVVGGGEEVGLADGHAQHRHLQPREPDAHGGRDALLGEDALEQQRHDLDGGALHRRGRRLLQLLFALVQLFQQHRRADVRAGGTARHGGCDGQAVGDALLRVGDGGAQCLRRRPRLLRVGEFGQLPADQLVQTAQHRFGVVGAAREVACARHEPRLVVHLGASVVGPRRDTRVDEAARGGTGRRRPGGVARAANEGPQVDLGQHALLDQPAVDFVVRLFGEMGELVVQHGLQGAPCVVAEPRGTPRIGDDAREHMGAQHVVRIELVAALEHGHARTHVGELPRRTVHHGEREARAEDLAFDRLVVDEAQAPAARRTGAAAGGREVGGARHRHAAALQRGAQRGHGALHPQAVVLREVFDGVAPAHHRGRIGHLTQQDARPVIHRLRDARQPVQQAFDVASPRLCGQCQRVRGGRHGSGVSACG